MALPLHLEFWLDGLVAVLLLMTVIFCLILNRQLTTLRGSQTEIQKLLSAFAEASRRAERSVSRLKAARKHNGSSLEKRLTDARALTDELNAIAQSGDRLAARIEDGLIGSASQERPSAVFKGSMTSPGNLSESKHELAAIWQRPG